MKKTITLLTLAIFLLLTACGSNSSTSSTKTESKPKSESGSKSTAETPSETASNDKCPASEYGYHDWSRATCQEPSHCYDCNKEKNDKLGSHYWDTDEDGRYCWDCGILYDDYINSLE